MNYIMFVLLFLSVSLAQANDAAAIASGKEKSITCAACHGQNGISTNPEWPNLAGQHAGYTAMQLKAFKEGKLRNNASMSAMVANLSEADMNDLALFYASLPLAEGVAAEKNLKRGEELYRGGDLSKGISACIACHGPKGLGNAQANFPVLSGQHAVYTVLQLKAYRSGSRQSDYNAIMRDISSRMSDEDMEAVANYIMGLH